MITADSPSSVLLQKVLGLVNKKVKTETSELASKFVNKLYGQMSDDDLAQRNDSDMYGAAIGLWNSLNQRKQGEVSIKVYNPELARHGWQSAHTIIEVIQDDSPFLVDSVQMTLNREGIRSHLLLHQPFNISRDKSNKVIGLFSDNKPRKTGKLESAFLIEIDRQGDEQAIKHLEAELGSVLDDVSMAVGDWKTMLDRLNELIRELPNRPYPGARKQVDQTVAFLKWLANDNLTLMGYRQFSISPVSGDYVIDPQMDTSLGLMKQGRAAKSLKLSELPPTAQEDALGDSLLILTKSNVKSRVHRPAYIDYIGIKRFDEKGNVVGEDRFIGLYASSLYNVSAAQIPMIGDKLQNIMKQSKLLPGSHAYKALLNVLETYPRDELIQSTEDEILETGMGVLQMQDRDMTRLFARKDTYGRFVSCLVYVPKDRYNTALRVKTQEILKRYFESESQVEFNTYFTEGVLARTQYFVRVKNNNMNIDVAEIQKNLVEAACSWDDKLQSALNSNFGEAKGNKLGKRYLNGFPKSYIEDVLPGSAVADIVRLEALSDNEQLGMLFYRAQEEQADSRYIRLKLFHKDEPIHLSDVLPMLENMGLRVIGESPYKVKTSDGKRGWILDFSMLFSGDRALDLENSQQRFQDAFAKVWSGNFEDDGFNRLVLNAGLSGREVVILRAYAKYMRQTGTSFSQNYIEDALNSYPELAGLIIELFDRKFSPSRHGNEKVVAKLEAKIIEQLDDVANLDDDRIIRRYVEMVNATLRTNYYQLDGNGEDKEYISFKMSPGKITEMPKPLPEFEIFVYSPRIEGVHLRGGKVARGGLRWSDRREDFRTEVLGLVKAQQVKNTVIVPVGAKGGFVCKKLPTNGGRAAFLEEGQSCYRTFIRALLDITDNIMQGEIVPPTDVVKLDEDDPYLVVAADKGTATFSDIANEISAEYDFWLGDAFASGGSVGYDHKKMGITARGAWESVKRHFREMGTDCQNTDFTCVGIGDMAGDVFGNGMLLSKHIRLKVAFNHMHIFIDPEPNAATSWVERKRLFDLPQSSWSDYDTGLISDGGGIFSRSAKSIKLTPQIKKMLGASKSSMAPNDLIRALLCMEVDLLWNGGIGTYVKARSETDLEVGDRANDCLRINGEELKVRVVGEGGNLGCTQLGRIEFAQHGGRIDTDFIDNVGGVDCSDNEVNIKILLNSLVTNGDLTIKQRNKLLYDMTENVSEIVLTNAYRQAQSISITELTAADQLKEQIRFIHGLEKDGKLDRAMEHLPTDDELSERMAMGKGLTRPELCVLLAYGKMVLKESLQCEEITQDPYIARSLIASFPNKLREKYARQMESHPLRTEIIATQTANRIVNDLGLNFVTRMRDETGASDAEIAMCYTMAREVFDLDHLWRQIEGLDNKIAADVQLRMMAQSRRIVRRGTRWFLRLRNRTWTIGENIEFFKPAYQELADNLYRVMVEEEVEQHKAKIAEYVEHGVPANLAEAISHQSTMFSALDVAQISQEHNQTIITTSDIYFRLGAKLDLHWFLEQINQQAVTNHWQALARASFREELDWQQRSLTSSVLGSCKDSEIYDTILDQWLEVNQGLLQRWHHMLADFKTSSTHEFAKFSVALRELNLLNLNCKSTE